MAKAFQAEFKPANESANDELRSIINDPTQGLLATELAFLRFHGSLLIEIDRTCYLPRGVVTDFAPQLDFAYAQTLLPDEQREVFNRTYTQLLQRRSKPRNRRIPKPSCFIVLTADPKELHRRIKVRQINQPHRLGWERNYTVDYLDRIQRSIKEYFSRPDLKVFFQPQDPDMSVQQVTQLLLRQF